MKQFDPIPMRLEAIASEVIDAAYHVHSTLGPGLLESVYERCLAHELSMHGRSVETQLIVT